VGALPGVTLQARDALASAGVQVRPLDEAAAQAACARGKLRCCWCRQRSRASLSPIVSIPCARGPPGPRHGRCHPGKRQRPQDPLAVRDQEVQERGSRYIDFLIPGLLAMNLMSGSMWHRLGDWRKCACAAAQRLLAHPCGGGICCLPSVCPAWCHPVRDCADPDLCALVFGVQVAGSYAALGLVGLAGSASFAAIAILVASRAQNTQTVSGLMNLVMLPMFVLSGVFFSSTHFPGSRVPSSARCH